MNHRVWDQMQNSDMPPPIEDITKWEAEFNQLMNSQDDDFDYGADMQSAWESGLSDFGGGSARFDEQGLPILEPYNFGNASVLRSHSLLIRLSTSRIE